MLSVGVGKVSGKVLENCEIVVVFFDSDKTVESFVFGAVPDFEMAITGTESDFRVRTDICECCEVFRDQKLALLIDAHFTKQADEFGFLNRLLLWRLDVILDLLNAKFEGLVREDFENRHTVRFGRHKVENLTRRRTPSRHDINSILRVSLVREGALVCLELGNH